MPPAPTPLQRLGPFLDDLLSGLTEELPQNFHPQRWQDRSGAVHPADFSAAHIADIVLRAFDGPIRSLSVDSLEQNKTLARPLIGGTAAEDKLLADSRKKGVAASTSQEDIEKRARELALSTRELVSPGKGEILQRFVDDFVTRCEKDLRSYVMESLGIDIRDLPADVRGRLLQRMARTAVEYARQSRNPAVRKMYDAYEVNSAKAVEADFIAAGNDTAGRFIAARGAGATRPPVEGGKSTRYVGTISSEVLDGTWPGGPQPTTSLTQDQILAAMGVIPAPPTGPTVPAGVTPAGVAGTITGTPGTAGATPSAAPPAVVPGTPTPATTPTSAGTTPPPGATQLKVVENYEAATVMRPADATGEVDRTKRQIIIPLHDLVPGIDPGVKLGVVVYEADILAQTLEEKAAEFADPEKILKAIKAQVQLIVDRQNTAAIASGRPAHFTMPSDDKIRSYLHRETTEIETASKQAVSDINALARRRIAGLFGTQIMYDRSRARNQAQPMEPEYRNNVRVAARYALEQIETREQEYIAQYTRLKDSLDAALTSIGHNPATEPTAYDNPALIGDPQVAQAAHELELFLNPGVRQSNLDGIRQVGNAGLNAFHEPIIRGSGPAGSNYTIKIAGREYYALSREDLLNQVLYDMQPDGIFAGKASETLLQADPMRDTDTAVTTAWVNRQAIKDHVGATRASDADFRSVEDAFITEFQAKVDAASVDYLNEHGVAEIAKDARDAVATAGISGLTGVQVRSILDEIAPVNLAIVRKRPRIEKGGNVSKIYEVKTSTDPANARFRQIEEEYRRTAKSELFESILTLRRLDTQTQADIDQGFTAFNTYAQYMLADEKSSSSAPLYRLLKKGYQKYTSALDISETKASFKRSLLATMSQYMSMQDAEFMLNAYYGRIARLGVARASAEFKEEYTKIVRNSDRYRSRRYAEAKALAKTAVIRDAIQKYELNPLSFNNIMRSELVSLIAKQSLTLAPDPIFLFGWIPVNAAAKLLIRPFVPGAAVVSDFIPILGTQSIFRKNFKELLPKVPNLFRYAEEYFLFPEAGLIKKFEQSLMQNVMVATHFWRRTDTGNQIMFSPKYYANYIPERIFDWFLGGASVESKLPLYRRVAAENPFGYRAGRGRFGKFLDRFKVLFYRNLLIRRERRQAGGPIAQALWAVGTSIAVSIFGAWFEQIGEWMLRSGVDEWWLFKRVNRFMENFNSNVIKSAAVGEGYFAQDWGKLTGWERVGKVIGMGLRYPRLFENFLFSATDGGIRAGLWGLLTFVATGGNFPLAFLVGGMHGGLRFLKGLTRPFVSVEKDGSFSLTSWARMGAEADANLFQRAVFNFVTTLTQAPRYYTMTEIRALVERDVASAHIRDAHFEINHIGRTITADPAEIQRHFQEYLDRKVLGHGTVREGLRTEIRDNLKHALSGEKPVDPQLLQRYIDVSAPGALETERILREVQNDPTFHIATVDLDTVVRDLVTEALRSGEFEFLQKFFKGHYATEGILSDGIAAAERQSGLSTTLDEWRKVAGANGVSNGDLFDSAVKDRMKALTNSDRLSILRDAHANGPLSSFLRDGHDRYWNGAGRGIVGKHFLPGFSAGMNAVTTFILLYNVNPLLAVSAGLAVGAYDLYGRKWIDAMVEKHITKPIVEKLATINTDHAFAQITHTAMRSLDVLWYAELSSQSGPISPFLQGLHDTGEGLGKVGHGLYRMITGDENGLFDEALPGLLQGSLGVFNVAGLGFGIAAMYGASDFLVDSIAANVFKTVLFADLAFNPIALGITAVIVGIDIVTGGALSRWVTDQVSRVAEFAWNNFLGPLWSDAVANHLGALVMSGVFGGLGVLALILSPLELAFWPVTLAFLGGATLGWFLYSYTPFGAWVDSFATSLAGTIGLFSFFVSFILLFRRRDTADVIIGVILMVISLGTIGVLAAFPDLVYNPTGYGTIANVNCIFPGATSKNTPGTCTQGNSTSASNDHQTHFAADIAPNINYTPVTDAEGHLNYIVISPVDGTIVAASNEPSCDDGYGFIQINVAPSNIIVKQNVDMTQVAGSGSGNRVSGNVKYDLSDVVITIIHVHNYQYILDGLKKGPIYVQKGEEIARLLGNGDKQISNDNLPAYPSAQTCWSGPHAHVEISYFNTQTGGQLGTCPAYNPVTVFADPNLHCAYYNGCGVSSSFGCSQLPVNSDYVNTPVPAASGLGNACPLNSALINELNLVADKTNTSAPLLAAELEYQNHLANPGVPGSTSFMGAGGLFNQPFSKDPANVEFNHQQQSDTYFAKNANQVERITRDGAMGLFSDISSSTSLQNQVEQCTNRSVFNLSNVEDNLYMAGLVFDDFVNGKTSIPLNNSFGCTDGGSPKLIDPNDSALILKIAQKYVCRGAEDGTGPYTGSVAYNTCGLNEAQSIVDLTQYFNTNCFGGVTKPTPSASVPTPSPKP